MDKGSRSDPAFTGREGAKSKSKLKAGVSKALVLDLDKLFAGERRRPALGHTPEETAATRWVRSALLQAPEAPGGTATTDFQSCSSIRRVVRRVELPSGPVLSFIDVQPADRAAPDRCFAQNRGLWESLPRGYAEVREGSASGRLLRQVVGLRKFGNAEEKFGPLAHEAGSSRRAALATLPAALDDGLGAGAWAASLVFLTKENGEMCKVSFFEYGSQPYLVIGSKNVVLAVSVACHQAAADDLATYTEERYYFAREMAGVFVERFFDRLTTEQRRELLEFVCRHGATLCGESISPEHQHIQSYRGSDGSIAPEIRFFVMTAPQSFESSGLTLLDPMESRALLQKWGLQTVDVCEEVPLSNAAGVQSLEERHLFLANREGAVVYVVVRARGRARTALVYKWKNAWYVTVRALREKFCSRASEARVWTRIRLLHVHHPDEEAIVEDYLRFYRWALALLPPSEFRDTLAGYWVSLKAAFDDFIAGEEAWAKALQPELVERLGVGKLHHFPAAFTSSIQPSSCGAWAAALSRYQRDVKTPVDELLGNCQPVGPPADSALSQGMSPMGVLGAAVDAAAEEDQPVGLTVVLVRGLQGSGKSTLCRGLRALLGGEWVNQDEVAAQPHSRHRGPSPRERFLQALEAAAAQPDVRYIFVDKIHTLRQHRDDARGAVARGTARRPAAPSRTAMVLLDLTHPEDDEGQSVYALSVCAGRVSLRGLGHLSFVPQESAVEEVIVEVSRNSEVVGDTEKCSFDLCADLSLTLAPADLLKAALARLEEAQLLMPGCQDAPHFEPEAVAAATAAAFEHERKLQDRWRTRYWSVRLQWDDLLGLPGAGAGVDPSREALRQALLAAFNDSADPCELQPVEDPHVTLLWLGDEDPSEETGRAHTGLLEYEGKDVRIAITAVTSDAGLGLVALRVALEGRETGREPPPCESAHAHVTTAKKPGVAAVASNSMLMRQAGGDTNVKQVDLVEPVCVKGIVSRQLASKSLAMVGAVGAMPEVGNPICDRGLMATGDAVDVWATYDARVRWTRLLRTFGTLFCPVSEPLLYCRGWPPQLRGKQWFTLHERPLSARSIATLRELARRGQLQTLHVGVAYFQVSGLLLGDKGAVQAGLVAALTGKGTDALRSAFAAWWEVRSVEERRISGPSGAQDATEEVQESPPEAAAGPPSVPKFYVQSKHLGSQDLTTRFRQALAAAVALLTGWEPVIKGADVTLSVVIRDGWILLGLLVPRCSSGGGAAGERAEEPGRRVRISKALTQVLRHSAAKHDIKIRPDGFCSASEVLRLKALRSLGTTLQDLRRAVAESDKQRFELREEAGEGPLVRAVQGHSMAEVLDDQLLQRLSPTDDRLPEVCMHGTYRRHLPSITSVGLLAGGPQGRRKHVHFTCYEAGDGRVISGMRSNCEVAVYIDLRQALADGVPFYMSANEVLLSPGVDGAIRPKYILQVWDLEKGVRLDMASSGLQQREASTADAAGHDTGVMQIDGEHLQGGGQLLRNACAYAAILRRTICITNVRGGRNPPGLRPGHVAAINLVKDLAGARADGVVLGGNEVTMDSSSGSVSPLQNPMVVDAGSGGSTMLMLQAALPMMLARSAASGGAEVRLLLHGGTNVAPASTGGNSAPQVDYVQLVMVPTLRRLFGLGLDLRLRRRGFSSGGGEVEICASCPQWPLRPFKMLEQGEAVRVRGIVYRSAGVPAHVLPRLIEGTLKKRPAGAAVVLREQLPGLPLEWQSLEAESTLGQDGCGVVVAIETASGCVLGGDSMGRRGVPAEKVGEEAALAALHALSSGSCADEFLEDQLVIFMALAAGRSCLHLGATRPSSHACTSLWLAERFGAKVEIREEIAGRVLEVEGLGVFPG